MSEKKPSFLSRLFNKESKPIRDEMKTLGLNVLADKKLEARIEEYALLYKLFQQPVQGIYTARLNEWRSRLQELDLRMQAIAVPYGRASSSQAYAQMMAGWRDLYAYSILIMDNVEAMVNEGISNTSKNFTETIKSLEGDYTQDEYKQITELFGKSQAFQQVLPFLDRKVVDKEELVSNLEHYLIANPIKYGFKIMAVSFSDKDVTPAYAAVIMNVLKNAEQEDAAKAVEDIPG